MEHAHDTHGCSEGCSDSGGSVFGTDLALPEARRGKVRDTYRLPSVDPGTPDRILMVASDRISAFDVVMPTPIPGKGRVLTAIAAHWLSWIEREGLGPTHLVLTDASVVPDAALTPTTTRAMLGGRVTIGKRCRVIPVECVVRGYLEGSGLKEYNETGRVCGVELPPGLVQCDRLPDPVFTPATKADEGHDENIDFERAAAACGGIVEGVSGAALMGTLRDRSIEIYTRAADALRPKGIILADTKFEFGLEINNDGEIVSDDPVLIDEALTPDSSRFWPSATYEPGRAQPSFDKQYLREYLETLVESGAWDKSEPGPALPDEVVEGTLARYTSAMDIVLSV